MKEASIQRLRNVSRATNPPSPAWPRWKSNCKVWFAGSLSPALSHKREREQNLSMRSSTSMSSAILAGTGHVVRRVGLLPAAGLLPVLFREQEALIQQRGGDDRHHFILSIPVADRPPHLRACLESIYQVCTLFNYGGNSSGAWDKIKIIVAEDSRDEKQHPSAHRAGGEYRQKGLQVFHFGLDEQYELLQILPPHQREQLGHLLTTQPREKFLSQGPGRQSQPQLPEVPAS